ncbi:MAG: hypothetical protein IKC46_10540 [Lachnospiraceae bacterium]|nr:hypothetical protein [Lachnospiraceae bacterium]
MGRLKDLLFNWISDFLYGVIASILATIVTPIVSAAILYMQSNAEDVPVWIWIVLGISISINIVSIVCNVLVLIKRENKPQFPSIKSDVKYEKLRTELYFETRTEIKCFREVKFKVLCQKLEYIRKQFTWTGDGYKGTYIDKDFENKYSIDSGSLRRFPPQIYDVIFDKPKKKGDFVHYKVRTEVTDQGKVMMPYLSQQITSPTKKLELMVTVPRGLISEVVFVEYADVAGKTSIGEPEMIEAKSVAGLEVYECEIKNPNLLHVYRIEWKFDK